MSASDEKMRDGPLFKDGLHYSRFDDVEIPKGLSVSEYVLNEAKEHGDAVALVDGPSDRSYTYTQVVGASRKVAAGLVAECAIKSGETVLICAPNIPEYALAFHGSILANAVVSTANPLYTDEELSHQLRNSGARVVITISMFADKLQSAIKLAGTDVSDMFLFDHATNAVAGTKDFRALLANDGSGCPKFDRKDDDTAVLPYSSGTTGLPKGVELTHQNLISNLRQLKSALAGDISNKDVLIGILPFFHIYGMVVILNASLQQGAKVVTMPKFEPQQFLELTMKHKISILQIVPPIVLFLAKHPVVEKFDLSSVRVIFSGAAPLSLELAQAATSRMPNVHMMQGYGMTETSPATHVTPVGGKFVGSAGMLVPNMRARIVSVENGENLGPGEDNRGELWVHGPNVMKGYLNNEDATKNTIDADGWLHTGDIGYADTEGRFFIVDRLKELIKYKGFQVPPAELEGILLTNDKIADAAVIGIPDEEAGELPRAYVVLKPDQELTADEVAKFVEGHVAPHKKLRGGVEFVEAIPKSASGKILRRELKAKALAAKAD